MPAKLRIGVVGLGIGRGHVRGYRLHPRAEVVAVCDTDPARLETVGEALGITARYTDAAAMLAAERIDILSVATPNVFHKPLTIAGLKAGCHVFCEKPMAMNAREGRAMVDAARRAGRRLMIHFSYRFSAPSQALRVAVDRGLLGEVYFGRTVWHRQRGMPKFGGWFGQKALAGGGPLIDLGVHRLDLALWLMGYPEPDWVLGAAYDPIAGRLAREQKKTFDVEDLAAGAIRFRNGATLIVEASWAANIAEKDLMETRLLGTKGGLVQRNLDGGYRFEAETFTERRGGRVETRRLPEGKRPPRPASWHFVEAIVRDRPHPATGEEGLVVMRLLDALYSSAALGRPVKVTETAGRAARPAAASRCHRVAKSRKEPSTPPRRR